MTRYINEAAAQWLAAARSGDYTKNTGNLKTIRADGTACHCFLGIAMELFYDGPTVTNNIDHRGGIKVGFGESDMDGAVYCQLTEEVRVKVGLSQFNAHPKAGAHLVPIWRQNDRSGMTLPELADWVERNAEHFFVPVDEVAA